MPRRLSKLLMQSRSSANANDGLRQRVTNERRERVAVNDQIEHPPKP